MATAVELALFGILPSPTRLDRLESSVGPLPEGALVGSRYCIEALLAESRQVEIYRALDTQTGGVVKLKRLAPGETKAADAEMAILSALHHPRVPRLLDVFDAMGRACFVQTYFEGPTVRQHFRERGPRPAGEVIAIMRSVLETLRHLHRQRPLVLHRDVKPANLVYLGPGEVALIDFDLAVSGLRRKRSLEVQDLTTAYTAGYAPPEQCIGHEAFPASDVYAVAASALYIATARHPIHLWDARRGRLVVPARIPAPLASVLAWMLEPALEARCPSATAALKRLSSLGAL